MLDICSISADRLIKYFWNYARTSVCLDISVILKSSDIFFIMVIYVFIFVNDHCQIKSLNSKETFYQLVNLFYIRTDKKLDIKYCWRASSFRMTLCRNSFLFTSAKFKMEPISLNYQNGEINIIMSDCLPWAF